MQININPDRDINIIYDIAASCATNFIKLLHCCDHVFDNFIIGGRGKEKMKISYDLQPVQESM